MKRSRGIGIYIAVLVLLLLLAVGLYLGQAIPKWRENSNYEKTSEEIETGDRIYYFIYTSPLVELTIGDNVVLGREAFANAAKCSPSPNPISKQ